MERVIGTPPDLCERRTNLESSFLTFYQKLGYKVQRPVSIYPSVDETTLFVGSTISVLKKSLGTNADLREGICLVQPCLRTQPRRDLANMAYIPDYNSFFHQAGILTGSGSYKEVCDTAFDFLTSLLMIQPEFIRVQTSSQFPEISDYWKKRFPNNTIADSHPQNYYKWRYGEDGLTGVGITFSVRSNLISEYRDIGNVIISYRMGFRHRNFTFQDTRFAKTSVRFKNMRFCFI